MQYSYERWVHNVAEMADSSDVAEDLPVQEAVQPAELKTLEQQISLNLEEGMQAYRQYQGGTQAGLWREEAQSGSDEAHWDGLAKLVADHVLAYLLDNPLESQLQELRLKNEEFYRDNRTMAEQVRRLVEENDGLRRSLLKAERELATFHKLGGSFYIKH